jgi:hypothetical protein
MRADSGATLDLAPPRCPRRQLSRQSLVRTASPAKTCGRPLPASTRRLLDRCRHNDPSLIRVRFKPEAAAVATCTLCDGLEFAVLAAALSANRHVRTLDVSGARLAPLAVRTLATLLARTTSLVHAVLDRTAIGDRGLGVLAPALARNRTLRSLSLRKVGAGFAGIAALAAALAHHAMLATLDIRSVAESAKPRFKSSR